MTKQVKKEYRWEAGAGYFEARFMLNADNLVQAYHDTEEPWRFVRLVELPTKVGGMEEVQVRHFVHPRCKYQVTARWDGKTLSIGCQAFKGARAKQIVEMAKAAKRRKSGQRREAGE